MLHVSDGRSVRSTDTAAPLCATLNVSPYLAGPIQLLALTVSGHATAAEAIVTVFTLPALLPPMFAVTQPAAVWPVCCKRCGPSAEDSICKAGRCLLLPSGVAEWLGLACLH